ncbi:transposable element Tcb2 transposase [Trichonephila clavipes]|nr:transposable element Tcb2 transposase [Trichonephila clavipes]
MQITGNHQMARIVRHNDESTSPGLVCSQSARYLLPQENTFERHRYGGSGWLVWVGIILGSRTDLHVQSLTMTGHIYRGVILEQHVRLFRGAMGSEFLFKDDNVRPQRANIVDECFQSEDITCMDWQHTHRT